MVRTSVHLDIFEAHSYEEISMFWVPPNHYVYAWVGTDEFHWLINAACARSDALRSIHHLWKLQTDTLGMFMRKEKEWQRCAVGSSSVVDSYIRHPMVRGKLHWNPVERAGVAFRAREIVRGMNVYHLCYGLFSGLKGGHRRRKDKRGGEQWQGNKWLTGDYEGSEVGASREICCHEIESLWRE